MKLAIAQMVFGGLIVAGGVANLLFLMLSIKGTFMWIRFITPFNYAFLILGLLVLGCGIAQFLKARRCTWL